jgi:hypothetical protein
MTPRTRRILLIVLGFILLIPATTRAQSSAESTLGWWSANSGGGHLAAGASSLDSSIGQALSGVARQDPDELCAGFLCGMSEAYAVYLPLVLHSRP